MLHFEACNNEREPGIPDPVYLDVIKVTGFGLVSPRPAS